MLKEWILRPAPSPKTLLNPQGSPWALWVCSSSWIWEQTSPKLWQQETSSFSVSIKLLAQVVLRLPQEMGFVLREHVEVRKSGTFLGSGTSSLGPWASAVGTACRHHGDAHSPSARRHQEPQSPNSLAGLSMQQLTAPWGFLGGPGGKECRRHKRLRFNPWVGKIPGRRAWQSTPVFLPGES